MVPPPTPRKSESSLSPHTCEGGETQLRGPPREYWAPGTGPFSGVDPRDMVHRNPTNVNAPILQNPSVPFWKRIGTLRLKCTAPLPRKVDDSVVGHSAALSAPLNQLGR